MRSDIPRLKLDDLREDHPGVFDDARYVDVGIGWLSIVRDFISMTQAVWPDLEIDELKEKFGSLRIHKATPPEAVRDEVYLADGLAEMRSMYRCEACGEPGYIRRPLEGQFAWLQCRCDEHATDEQRSWPKPDFYENPYVWVAGIKCKYDPVADTLEVIDPPLATLPHDTRYPR